MTDPRAIAAPGRVMERGRSKAHRPLPADVRRAAVARGIAAYDRGAWYLAHEELEPAWMGTADLAERSLLSGLIKVAAAYVHAARGNPLGVRTNLRGARERLAAAINAASTGPETRSSTGREAKAPPADATLASGMATEWIDLPALLTAVDDRLARVEAICAGLRDAPMAAAGASRDAPHDVAGPAGRIRGAPVAIPTIPLPRRPA